MYSCLLGVTFMSNCVVTLLWYLSEISLPSVVSLVWPLCVRLAFLLPSCERSLVLLPRFFCHSRWRRRRVPSFSSPRPVGARVRRTIIYKVQKPFTSFSVVGVIVDTPRGLPTLSGFSAVISAG